jgi:OmpA-OmpF porin, OOP family
MRKINSLLFVLLTALPPLVFSQKLSLGVFSGASSYLGDVTEQFYFRGLVKNKPSVGGFLKYDFNDKFSIRANYLQGEISGDEREYHKIPWRVERGFNFKSPIKESSLIAEWTFLKKRFGNYSRSKSQAISLYLMAGLGYVKTNPVVDFNEPNSMFEDVNSDKLAQYNRNHVVIPLGMGVKWQISKHKTLGLEVANRTTFTDYLDGISKLAQPKNGDWYFVSTVSISQDLTWGSNSHKGRGAHASVSCPKFR